MAQHGSMGLWCCIADQSKQSRRKGGMRAPACFLLCRAALPYHALTAHGVVPHPPFACTPCTVRVQSLRLTAKPPVSSCRPARVQTTAAAAAAVSEFLQGRAAETTHTTSQQDSVTDSLSAQHASCSPKHPSPHPTQKLSPCASAARCSEAPPTAAVGASRRTRLPPAAAGRRWTRPCGKPRVPAGSRVCRALGASSVMLR